MKKIFVIPIIVIIAAVGLLSYQYIYLPSLPPKNVVLALPVPPEQGHWFIKYAIDKGFFQDEKLNVTYTVMQRSTDVMNALIAGEADFGTGVGDAIRAHLGGAQQLKIVATFQRASFSIFTHSDIESINEIDSIAIPGRGADGDVLLRELLLAEGLEPDIDIELRYLIWPAVTPAFLEGEVDAMVMGTAGYQALQAGHKLLSMFAEDFPEWRMNGAVTTDEMITEKPEVVKGFIKALYRSMMTLRNDKEEALSYAVNDLELDEDYANFIYEYAFEGKYGLATKIEPDLSIQDLENEMKISAKYMEVDELPISEFVDTSFLEQVKNELR